MFGTSSQLDDLMQENERLREENERWKDSIRKYNNIKDSLEEQIDNLSEQIKERNKEIDRLKLEPKLKSLSNKGDRLTREHLNDVLNKEIRKQFPNDTSVQAHIGAIRSFNASYINALVTA